MSAMPIVTSCLPGPSRLALTIRNRYLPTRMPTAGWQRRRLVGLASTVACLLYILQLLPLSAAEVASEVIWLLLLNATLARLHRC